MEKNNGLKTVNIETASLACMIHQLATLLDGVWNSCCSVTERGVLCGDSIKDVSRKEEAENAHKWITENYTTVAGAIGVAKEIAETLSAVVIDYDVTVTKL